MDSLGKRTYDAVLAAEKPEASVRELSEHALAMVLDHAEETPGWAAQSVFGMAGLEAIRRFRLDHQQPDFP
jgi:CheY-like chemotaxis protein